MNPIEPRGVPLTPEQVAEFHETGYLRVERIAPPEEVERLRGIFDRLFAERAGWKQGKSFDLAGADEAGTRAVLPQIINPVEFAPELTETAFRVNALALARQLLGPEAEPWFEHAICKPAGIGAPTPWHQDEAHRYDPGVDYDQLSIWMPLQEATLENGCMHYLPGSHRGTVLEHRSLDGDARKSALECVGAFDPSQAVACPLPPGGAAMHHARTLHCAGANTTSAPRRAYILAFRGAPRSAPERAMYPWLKDKHTAASERAQQWENRGGALGRGTRHILKVTNSLAQRVSRRLHRWVGSR